jgi:NAD(P)-dependent dehydrogenase (short-subunit alcohol dehydrogenase family)
MQQYHDVMAVNGWGMIDVTVTFLPLIRKEAGRVVNVASVIGRVALPCTAPYAISKYAVEAFSDCLR